MSDFLGDWQAWHDRREARLVAPYGFLSITGLHWLTGEPTPLDGLPGRWRGDSSSVVVELADGESLELGGTTITGLHRFARSESEEDDPAFGDVRIEIGWRGETPIVRPRNPEHPLRTEHVATPTFVPDERWRVPARMRPAEAMTVDVTTMVEGFAEPMPVAGVLEFEVEGEPHGLIAFDDEDDLWVLFADATSGVTTYGAGRQLVVAVPDPDGVTTIDFNRAFNLPCAYSEFTTCPFPPPGNRLTVAIEAGEKLP